MESSTEPGRVRTRRMATDHGDVFVVWRLAYKVGHSELYSEPVTEADGTMPCQETSKEQSQHAAHLRPLRYTVLLRANAVDDLFQPYCGEKATRFGYLTIPYPPERGSL